MQLKKQSSFLAAIAALAVLVSSTAAPIQAAYGYSDVTVANRSSFSIYHIYVSPTKSGEWENDELGARVLQPGHNITLHDSFLIGHYDLKLVDEDDDDCIVPNVAINQDSTWSITSAWLLNCEFHN